MKIAIICPWAITNTSVGGTERFCMDLGEGLLSRKHQVTIFMLSGKSHVTNGITYQSLDLLGNEAAANEYDLHRLLGDFSNARSFNKLASFVEANINGADFDVIHINSLLLVRAWQDYKRVFTIHTNPYEYTLDWGEAGYRKTLQFLVEEANSPLTKLTAPSQFYADYFSQETKVTVSFIPHALDTARITSDKPNQILRKKYGLNADKTTLLLPSRLEMTQKRPQIAFEAAVQLPAAQRKNMQIIAAGLDEQYAPFRRELQTIADVAEIEVHFLKFDNMADAYALADIVGLPSCSESFGYSALESLALEKPTILNNIPTYHEIGADNPNAYFFENTVKAFHEQLRKVLANCHSRGATPSTWSDRYDTQRWARQYELVIKI